MKRWGGRNIQCLSRHTQKENVKQCCLSSYRGSKPSPIPWGWTSRRRWPSARPHARSRTGRTGWVLETKDNMLLFCLVLSYTVCLIIFFFFSFLCFIWLNCAFYIRGIFFSLMTIFNWIELKQVFCRYDNVHKIIKG